MNNQFGERNPNYKNGSHLRTPKQCPICGKKMDSRAKKCNNKHLSGINHPAFIPGLNRIYPVEFSKELKRSILKRDNLNCQMCNKKGNHVHHIDYNKQNCDKNNLITLYKYCHPKTNWNRDYWFNHFNNRNNAL